MLKGQDFIVKLADAANRSVIFETKSHDERLAEKSSAAARWVDAINRDGRFAIWS